eukprot:GEMP01137655.1.p2 GENE.GEMP01137655.1~~GEMP01137655.1.p2  ORF type:complete len:122 (+),score=13.65 GEMP01137655.1:49-366(+)
MAKKMAPPCGECGHRHGEPGHDKTCTPPVPGIDGSRKTSAEAGAQKHASGHDPSEFEVPVNLIHGTATAAGNNCLIHSIVQLLHPRPIVGRLGSARLGYKENARF